MASVKDGGLVIVPLAPERVSDLATLFSQGGDAKWCWCSYYRVRRLDFRAASAATNRQVLEAAVDATEREGRGPGLLAYRNGLVIGWVSVGPRDDYERLAHSRSLAPVDETPVWSIVCFVVRREARGEGVAAALLEAAVAYAAERRAVVVEAYPVERTPAMRPTQMHAGTLGMFERAGFHVVRRTQHNRAAPVRAIVRRYLAT